MWFCFPSQEGKPGQAGTGWGRGRAGRGAEAVGTASVPHVSLAHPPRLCFWFGEHKREKQNETFCFVWETEGGYHALALGERATGRGSPISGPLNWVPPGYSLYSPVAPPHGNLSTPPQHSESCLHPTPVPCLSEASFRTQNRGPVQLSFPCLSWSYKELAT